MKELMSLLVSLCDKTPDEQVSWHLVKDWELTIGRETNCWWQKFTSGEIFCFSVKGSLFIKTIVEGHEEKISCREFKERLELEMRLKC